MVRNRFLVPAAFLISVLGATYFLLDPAESRIFPACPFHLLTGLDCPGCGSQRALHAILHGKISLAADYNFLLVMSLPLLAANFAGAIGAYVKKKPHRFPLIHHPAVPKICLMLVLLFWIIRNTSTGLGHYLAA